MKTTRTFFIFVVVVAAVILLSSFLTQPSVSGNKYATIRVLEAYTGDSRIVTIYEDGKVEEIELEHFRQKNFTDNSKKIHDAINAVANKGYQLVSSSSGSGDATIITSFVFTKN